MSEKPLDGRQTASPRPNASRQSIEKSVQALPFKALSVVAALVVGLALGYVLGVLAPVTHLGGSSSSDLQLGPVFHKVPSDNLFSSTNLIQGVGGGPADPAKVLFPSLEKPSTAADMGPQTATPPQAAAPPVPKGDQASPQTPEGVASSSPEARSPAGISPRPVETPVIVTKEPGRSSPVDLGAKVRKRGKRTSEQLTGSEPSGWDTVPKPAEDKSEKVPEVKAPKEITSAAPAQNKTHVPEEASKREQFQLPGSLLVKIHNYSGVMTQWGLMVILDDSAVMARKARPWTPSRSQAAESFVAKLVGHLTPGSKLAVRDFLCKQPDAAKKHREGPCLTHMLYEWTESPFAGLKEKLARVTLGGHTNPCAAAAYSLKKDFAGAGSLKPRILIVTGGTAKCPVNEVVKAAEQRDSKDKTAVDVLAIGMGKKTEAGYSNLVKKCSGLLLKVDNPSDVEAALSRYGKVLKTRTMEKIEVRNEKGVFNINPEEEITLPPGSYTVVLPVVAGLSPSKRIVPNVRVTSEQANILDVRIRKGKPVIGMGKK